MDTDRFQKYVSVYLDSSCGVRQRLVEKGIVGLIHYVPYQTSDSFYGVKIGGYGVPVKKKE